MSLLWGSGEKRNADVELSWECCALEYHLQAPFPARQCYLHTNRHEENSTWSMKRVVRLLCCPFHPPRCQTAVWNTGLMIVHFWYLKRTSSFQVVSRTHVADPAGQKWQSNRLLHYKPFTEVPVSSFLSFLPLGGIIYKEFWCCNACKPIRSHAILSETLPPKEQLQYLSFTRWIL